MSNHTAVIGQPIEHSVSPKIHNFWIKENKNRELMLNIFIINLN